MTPRENILKAIRFDTPDHIPMSFHINPACWHHYDHNALQDLMESHPLLCPDFKREQTVEPAYLLKQLRDQPYTDPWGCMWTTPEDGLTGSVHTHPLETWDNFDSYIAPNPNQTDGTYPIDWQHIRNHTEKLLQAGHPVNLGLPHGHTYLRLQDIRGYENLTFDMTDDHPNLAKLITMVEQFNYQYVRNCLALNPDIMRYPEDLGMQRGPMLSPEHFRKYIKPSYQRLMKPARDQGCIVHMHSDGDIRTLVDDLIDGGVEVINLQDLVNGIDWIADKFAGHTCIDLDVDRQLITARGTPRQIDNLIRKEVTQLASKKGGLMMLYGLYPGTPLENVKATMDAMEKYATYYT